MAWPNFTSEQQLAVASLSGAADLFSMGRERDVPREEAVAELHAITGDPVILGHVLGGFLSRDETERSFTPTIALLRAAGADEGVAAARLELMREGARKYA